MRRGHVPMRTCTGCRTRAPKIGLLRVRAALDGTIVWDPIARAGGRGAYVHERSACVEAALAHGGLARALRTGITPNAASRLRELFTEMQERA